MANDLDTLVRLRQWAVDEKRRKLGQLIKLQEALERQGQMLEEELVREQAVAAAAPAEAGFLYANYAEAVIQRRRSIEQSLAKVQGEIDEARDELRHAYRELKKYEVAQAGRTRRKALERARKDQAALDEVGQQGHLRRRRDEGRTGR